ncbi:MAG: serine/threonine-protein kinase [Labilithrix sp.]|nr:serine/threonine-protein kinase [Labilithrix sp.]
MRELSVPGYQVWGLLGEGGMSEVWLAKHEVLAAPVVVKTLRRALRASDTQGAAARILQEARLMARVASPRIVRALDAGEIPGVASEPDDAAPTPFLVQEYVDGLDFAELDRRRRATLGIGLPLWLVCHVMREICTGLRAAHQAGVIHRDLKPSNVFGEPQSGIRLGDFGIAVARSDGSPPESAGTLPFMAPEQLRHGDVGRFTDVWGAGATACDLRYGQPPFGSVGEILDANAAPRLPPPSSPAEAYFQDVIRRMLAKDVRDRPADVLAPLSHFAMLNKALEPPEPAVSRVGPSALLFGRLELCFAVGDIAAATADAIVSSANFELRMRSGVGEALRLRGGDELEREAMAGGQQPLGSCVRTGAGALQTGHVFHAVSAWNEVSCVGRAFARALILAEEHGCASIAAPALGTGAARVGVEMCANAMMTTLRWHTMLGGTRVRKVTIWLDSEAKRRLYQDVAEEVLGLHDGRHFGPPDIGLSDDNAVVTPDGATFLDPRPSGR